MEELGYMLMYSVLVVIAIFMICVLFNPDFWQGYRNSKYLDEMMKEEEENTSESDETIPDIRNIL